MATRTPASTSPSDPLSDLLRLSRARIAATGGFAVRGTFGFRIPAPGQIVLAVVARGACWLRLEHHAPLRLVEGDVGLLSGRASFVMASEPSGPALDVSLTDETKRAAPIDASADCVVIAGRVTLDRGHGALLADVLPGRILVGASSPRASGLRALLEQLALEHRSEVAGARVVSEKIAELVLVQVLREHLASETSLPPGWLAAVTDDRIARALRVMHGEPGRAWSVDALAKAAGMSRTRFAVRFRDVAGIAPLAYLATWRMRCAERALAEEDTPVRAIAASLGYASEGAFSHAFKRITGLSPSEHRVRARGDDAVASMERTRKPPSVSRIRGREGAP